MKVIGYKGSETDRWASWNAMLNYKGSHNLLKNNPGEWEQRVAARDKNMFGIHLEHYVKDNSNGTQISKAN